MSSPACQSRVGELEQRPLGRVAGVVDDRVDAAVGRERFVRRTRSRSSGAVDAAARRAAAELAREGLDVRRAGKQRNPVAARGELARARGAHAFAGRGNESDWSDLGGHARVRQFAAAAIGARR